MSSKKAKNQTLSPSEQQRICLEECKKRASGQAFYMKRCLDSDKLMDALKHASNMVGELRYGSLSPKNYYDLYMHIFDHLKHLEGYLDHLKHLEGRLDSEKHRGERMSKLYELVQYAGNVLPRLYLLITVGSAYISSKEAPARDILQDLVEMCKGVQHPLRGLFLRNFLAEMTRNKLPDMDNEYTAKDGGTTEDSIAFILGNFTEMNKLWVRMQPPARGSSKEKAKREQERKDLRLLVGKTLAALGRLDGLTAEMYQKTVFPEIIEQIISCGDVIAQQYLMECVVQIFPDEFHLPTLNSILQTFEKLLDGVDVKSITVSLLNRLADFAARQDGPVQVDMDVFEIFFTNVSSFFESKKDMGLTEKLEMNVALLSLTLEWYPDNRDNVARVLTFVSKIVSQTLEKCKITTQSEISHVVQLLTKPLKYFDPLILLSFDSYTTLQSSLKFTNRAQIAVDLLRAAIDRNTKIIQMEELNSFLRFLQPIIGGPSEDDAPEAEIIAEDQLVYQQQLLGCLVHLCHNASNEDLLRLYVAVARAGDTALNSPAFKNKETAEVAVRVEAIFVPVIFRVLAMAQAMTGSHASRAPPSTPSEAMAARGKSLFQFVYKSVLRVAGVNPRYGLKLFLQAATSAGNCGFGRIAADFLAQALVLYEEKLAEDAEVMEALTLVSGTLELLSAAIEGEKYIPLARKTAKFSHRHLLKKPDQCRSILRSTHLFGGTQNPNANNQLCLECLKTCLRIADDCMEPGMNVRLFVEILAECVYYYVRKSPAVSSEFIGSLIALINTNLSDDGQSTDASVLAFYHNTIKHAKAHTSGLEDVSN